jgi:hypothetical protein
MSDLASLRVQNAVLQQDAKLTRASDLDLPQAARQTQAQPVAANTSHRCQQNSRSSARLSSTRLAGLKICRIFTKPREAEAFFWTRITECPVFIRGLKQRQPMPVQTTQ